MSRIFQPTNPDSTPLFELDLAGSELLASKSATSHCSLATNADVRSIVFASATRGRNLSVIGSVGVLAVVMLGLGLPWSALGVLGFGTMLYSCLVTRDAVSPKFLAQLLSSEEGPVVETGALSEASQARLLVDGLEERMRVVYRGVLDRQTELQEQLSACPSGLQASLPKCDTICDTVLAHAERLVLRGQRLYTYLESTELSSLRQGFSLVNEQVQSSSDVTAAKILKQVATARQQHIETHVEVEGLYERVLAQLLLIETILAGTIARIVKVMATDDEQSSMTVELVTDELEILLSDVEILESSLDEVALQHSGLSLTCKV